MKLISIAALTASVLIAGSGLIVAAKAPIDPNAWRFAGPVSADVSMAEANTTVMPALSFPSAFWSLTGSPLRSLLAAKMSMRTAM